MLKASAKLGFHDLPYKQVALVGENSSSMMDAPLALSYHAQTTNQTTQPNTHNHTLHQQQVECNLTPDTSNLRFLLVNHEI